MREGSRISKKVARTLGTSAGRSARRRRRVRPPVRKAAGRSLMLALLAIPACAYLLYCLCPIGGQAHFHLNPVGTSPPSGRIALGRQGLDDAAVGDRATPALTDDVAQFTGQPGQVGELALHLGEVRAGNRVDLGAGAVAFVG